MEVNVKEYWIVDLDARVVERWAQGSETPEIVLEQLVWRPGGTNPGNNPGSNPMIVDLRAFFDRIAAKRMFRR
jgi:hypothetical protein